MIIDNNVYIHGDLEVNGSLYCNGTITFEDLDLKDIKPSVTQPFVPNVLGINHIINTTALKSTMDLFIDGDIVLNKKYYNIFDIYERIKIVDEIPTMMTLTIKGETIKIDGKINSDNFYTNNNNICVSLRKDKIKKFYNKN